MTTTIGTYIAQRLYEIGIKDYFAIPGDYNLTLLDELLKNSKLRMINCCNELNAGYAADGYARQNGVSALVVTYSVGGLSAINAIAGAYAENLPIIVLSGAPNTNSAQDAEILHHTLGIEDYSYVRNMFARVCAESVLIHNPKHAPHQIDKAIQTAIQLRKPVYLEIACNIANTEVSSPTPRRLNCEFASDPTAIQAAVDDAAFTLNNAIKPVLVAGSATRAWNVGSIVEALSKKASYALASMPDAKGFVSEQHPNYIGIYWGAVSSPGCCEIIESSDCYLFIGPQFNDYTTTGHTTHLIPKKLIAVYPTYVNVTGRIYTAVHMHDFLNALSKKLKPNNASLIAYKRIAGEAPLYNPPKSLSNAITTRYLFAQIQSMLNANHCILAETGDSWFNCMRLKLPKNCLFEIQMQYGSIGWSVGALLGLQLALENKKRVIALIGDGSFQMSAQEISTMIRYDIKPIIFLINNASYTIEVQIHDGPYNVINNWKYAELVKVFKGENGNGWSTKVRTCAELLNAIKTAKKHDGLAFIEVLIDRDDCNKNLLEWGSHVAAYNSRPPRS
ncbi:MAG: thiamine pyrophosphate-binding protein [Gammaproteobacteria bacterium]